MSGMGHDDMTGAAARSIRIARIGRPGCDVRDDLGRIQGLPCHVGHGFARGGDRALP